MTYSMPTYSSRTCRRCRGTGQHSNYGGDTRCFSCKGTGSEQVQSGTRPLTPTELAAVVDYAHGEAFVEDRARARAARRAAR
jgi:DnaJ-class molecular chaperone